MTLEGRGGEGAAGAAVGAGAAIERTFDQNVALALVWIRDRPGGGAGAPRRCRWA